MNPIEVTKGEFLISTDRNKLNLELIHTFLATEAGWCNDIPFKTVKYSIANSLNFGIYKNDEQVGFARIISDYATIAYLGDVFVLDVYRGFGLSSWLMEVITNHPNLQGLRRWILLTDTAPWLYKKFGFTAVRHPEYYMEKHDPGVYKEEI
ncbi:GNAT family N-acetyltransferase [Zhouia amylolytica]|uniref:GNAT family N-acetyltransferase n=1 Tax=Zhouia amylolytica TaxID=376730 RepID=UPI0020CF9E7D|nr:GNAT family N-acetyltransferase [Zhouia amylolytica]MCQ0111142.1 GNAT family N-acetyltransferase [Zhouia amylolytica]